MEASEYAKTLVDNIRDTVEAIADGTLYRDADGDYHGADDVDVVPDDWETYTMTDYLENVYDVQYIVGYDARYIAGRVMVAGGGPTVWVDTHEQAVCLYWAGTDEKRYLSYGACDQLDDVLRELWDGARC